MTGLEYYFCCFSIASFICGGIIASMNKPLIGVGLMILGFISIIIVYLSLILNELRNVLK